MQRIWVGGEKTILFSQKEAASFLGVSERTMRNYIKRGLIPACTVKRRTYIWENNLVQFLRGAKSHRNLPTIEPPEFEAPEFEEPPDPWD